MNVSMNPGVNNSNPNFKGIFKMNLFKQSKSHEVTYASVRKIAEDAGLIKKEDVLIQDTMKIAPKYNLHLVTPEKLDNSVARALNKQGIKYEYKPFDFENI